MRLLFAHGGLPIVDKNPDLQYTADMKTATIISFGATPGSGLGRIVLDTESGIEVVHCDLNPTVRLLDDMFPGFITGTSCDASIIIGQQISFDTDALGMLAALEEVF